MFNLKKIIAEITWPKLRRYLFTGVLTLLPVVVTIYVLWTLFVLVDSILGSLLYRLLGENIWGLGLLAFLVLALVVGMFVTNVIGRQLFSWMESLIKKIPLANIIYNTIKQMSDAIFPVRDGKKSAFRRVVLVQYPRQGIFSLGFVTGEGLEFKEYSNIDLVKVFIVSTPNPTTGFLIFAPREEVIDTDFTIEEGMRIIISGGTANISQRKRK
ncbi:MAG: hypothetical protein DDT40_01542 [candidate division WS2 bacterium]|uniref:DUF502 domain-containing protein n=1 Tax=Psychracetigena formicireducens TaxID=2986056 RepID=A0A9E2F7J3_PSYF1|nr:hypothetical protein [Candidatus Psychracetigena formicireducens]MBT9145648.1 hypothetical protein [Candidatus Psychracetigena formicireducens]MBT9151349.1 hypothetical protein [Candidatus Psychracetigena formicireducens]